MHSFVTFSVVGESRLNTRTVGRMHSFVTFSVVVESRLNTRTVGRMNSFVTFSVVVESRLNTRTVAECIVSLRLAGGTYIYHAALKVNF
jgi:hypothetical protein